MRIVNYLFVSAIAIAAICTIPDARATTVYIDSIVSGCGPGGGACVNGVANLPPGATVNLIDPEKLTLGPGTYSITNAATTGYYSAWNFSSGWVWSFGVTTDNGNGTGNVFYVGFGTNVHSTQSDAATAQEGFYGGPGGPSPPQLSATDSVANFLGTFTLASTTTLDFFTLDYYPYDNSGGVALNINSTATPLPSTWLMLLSGFAALGFFAYRGTKKNSTTLAA